MDLRAINLDMLEPHSLIEMLETDLQVGKQLFEHFGQQPLRSWRSHRGTGGVEENLFLAPGEGDTPDEDLNGSSSTARNGDAKAADALRVLRGEVR